MAGRYGQRVTRLIHWIFSCGHLAVFRTRCIVKDIEKENGKLFSHEIYLTSLDKQGVCPTITTGTPTGSYHLELLD